MNTPGPFALSKPERVRTILKTRGWANVCLQAVDLACGFSASDLDMLLTYLALIGGDVASLDEHAQIQLRQVVRTAYEL